MILVATEETAQPGYMFLLGFRTRIRFGYMVVGYQRAFTQRAFSSYNNMLYIIMPEFLQHFCDFR